ncbi:MAG TPA: hypothetical protein VF669_12720 [Tepidisphaeraceae bacterium]
MHANPKRYLESAAGPQSDPPRLQNLTDAITPESAQKCTKRNKFEPLPLKPPDDPTLSPAARAIIGMRSRFQSLKEHHHLAIELLIRGLNDREVAEQLGKDRSQITKWRNYNPYFRAELARRRQEVFGSFSENLRSTLSTCLEELQSQLRADDVNLRNRAANQIINHAKSRSFQPPPEPTDPATLMAQLARQKRIEWHLHDNPFYAPLEEDDYLKAMEDLDEKERNFPLAPDPHPTTAEPPHSPPTITKKEQRPGGGRPGPLSEGRVRIV